MSGSGRGAPLAERVLLTATRTALIALGLTAGAFGVLVAADLQSGSPAAVALGVLMVASIATGILAVLAACIAAVSLGGDANRVFLKAFFFLK